MSQSVDAGLETAATIEAQVDEAVHEAVPRFVRHRAV
jgi:hypothetical protein